MHGKKIPVPSLQFVNQHAKRIVKETVLFYFKYIERESFKILISTLNLK